MKTTKIKEKSISPFMKGLITFFLFAVVITSCSKDDNSDNTNRGFASSYSGSGSFNFAGDYNMSFSGNANNVIVTSANDFESIPISFIDSQGLELFIGLRSPSIEPRVYNVKEVDTEGYSGIFLEGQIYDSGAIGGTGTVTLNTVNRNRIDGSVNMRLARPLNTADTIVVTGTFELIGQ